MKHLISGLILIYSLNFQAQTLFESNKKWGLKDANNKVILQPEYDVIRMQNGDTEDLDFSDFFEGYYRARIDNKWGFIHESGKKICDIKYEDVGEFMGKRGAYKLNGKWGILDTAGVELIPPIYDEISSFQESRAVFKLNGKYGYLNKKGQEAIPAIYDFADYFFGGEAIVKQGETTFYINRKGEKVEK